MRKLPMEQINAKNCTEIIDDLRSCRYSLLESAGCSRLRKEMNGIGLLCRMIINVAWKITPGGDTHRHDRRVARKLANFLSWGAPANYVGEISESSRCVVVGFNHPSLGEILRFVALSLKRYRYRKMLFPVNLPWYEVLMPVVDKLEAIGIYITPIITPSTFEKMKQLANSENLRVIEAIREAFSMHYIKLCASFADELSLIWVAPSATRRATVFNSKAEYDNEVRAVPPTITLLATAISRVEYLDCSFIPTAVVPPKDGGRGLNLFRRYTITFGEAMGFSKVNELLRKRCEHHRGRMLEYEFLMNICNLLRSSNAEDLLYP